MLKILKEPNNLLYKKCSFVTDFEEAKQIVNDLVVVMKSLTKWWNIKFGFAANQIGYSKRIVGLRKGRNQYQVLINPVLVEKRFPFPYIETCFSLKNKKYYFVKRYLWTKVEYQDLDGKPHEIILRGPSAIYQEMDHIDGIMVSKIGFQLF